MHIEIGNIVTLRNQSQRVLGIFVSDASPSEISDLVRMIKEHKRVLSVKSAGRSEAAGGTLIFRVKCEAPQRWQVGSVIRFIEGLPGRVEAERRSTTRQVI